MGFNTRITSVLWPACMIDDGEWRYSFNTRITSVLWLMMDIVLKTVNKVSIPVSRAYSDTTEEKVYEVAGMVSIPVSRAYSDVNRLRLTLHSLVFQYPYHERTLTRRIKKFIENYEVSIPVSRAYSDQRSVRLYSREMWRFQYPYRERTLTITNLKKFQYPYRERTLTCIQRDRCIHRLHVPIPV